MAFPFDQNNRKRKTAFVWFESEDCCSQVIAKVRIEPLYLNVIKPASAQDLFYNIKVFNLAAAFFLQLVQPPLSACQP